MLPIKRKQLGLLVSRPDDVGLLSQALNERNWSVSASLVLADENASIESLSEAEVLVVDLADAQESEFKCLNNLIGEESRPVLFNDASHDKDWLQHLISKLEELPEATPPSIGEQSDVAEPHMEVGDNALAGAAEEVVDDSNFDIWLISASLGGPKVLRDLFLAVLPELPVCFLVTQRIAVEHIDTLVNYLSQYSRYDVSVMDQSIAWDRGKIILVPDGFSFAFDEFGALSVTETSDYSGDELDSNINALAERYGQQAGVMVLSAVSEQGVSGCEQMLDLGGRVWLHDDLPRYFDQFVGNISDDDRVISGSAVALAERLNARYAS